MRLISSSLLLATFAGGVSTQSPLIFGQQNVVQADSSRKASSESSNSDSSSSKAKSEKKVTSKFDEEDLERFSDVFSAAQILSDYKQMYSGTKELIQKKYNENIEEETPISTLAQSSPDSLDNLIYTFYDLTDDNKNEMIIGVKNGETIEIRAVLSDTKYGIRVPVNNYPSSFESGGGNELFLMNDLSILKTNWESNGAGEATLSKLNKNGTSFLKGEFEEFNRDVESNSLELFDLTEKDLLPLDELNWEKFNTVPYKAASPEELSKLEGTWKNAEGRTLIISGNKMTFPSESSNDYTSEYTIENANTSPYFGFNWDAIDIKQASYESSLKSPVYYFFVPKNEKIIHVENFYNGEDEVDAVEDKDRIYGSWAKNESDVFYKVEK